MEDTVSSHTNKPISPQRNCCAMCLNSMCTCVHACIQLYKGCIPRIALTPQNMQKPYKTPKCLKTKQKHSLNITWGASCFLNNLFFIIRYVSQTIHTWKCYTIIWDRINKMMTKKENYNKERMKWNKWISLVYLNYYKQFVYNKPCTCRKDSSSYFSG